MDRRRFLNLVKLSATGFLIYSCTKDELYQTQSGSLSVKKNDLLESFANKAFCGDFLMNIPVLTPQITGHNLKNKLGLIKFGNHDTTKTKIYT
ncbi:MAG: hypothetical protein GYA51_18405 [Candidatus Methanofastidiosa archaeon]|nr:hypothetical protein [Candidatus Methanofastidiosa archaeon]